MKPTYNARVCQSLHLQVDSLQTLFVKIILLSISGWHGTGMVCSRRLGIAAGSNKRRVNS